MATHNATPDNTDENKAERRLQLLEERLMFLENFTPSTVQVEVSTITKAARIATTVGLVAMAGTAVYNTFFRDQPAGE